MVEISNNATYSLTNVSVTINGPGINKSIGALSGFAEGAVAIAMDEDKTNLNTGGGGSWMHSLHAGNAGTITFNVLKNSPINEFMASAYNLQRTSSILWGKNIITIVNTGSDDQIIAIGGAFQRIPNLNYAKDGDTMGWAFRCGQITHKLGNYQGWGSVTDNGGLPQS